MLLNADKFTVGSPDGVAVVRVKPEYASGYPQEWLFASLRAEASRIQLWTESGGTSYGKLTPKHINDVLISVPSPSAILDTVAKVQSWAQNLAEGFEEWDTIGTKEDRRPIINSAIIGLDADEDVIMPEPEQQSPATTDEEPEKEASPTRPEGTISQD